MSDDTITLDPTEVKIPDFSSSLSGKQASHLAVVPDPIKYQQVRFDPENAPGHTFVNALFPGDPELPCAQYQLRDHGMPGKPGQRVLLDAGPWPIEHLLHFFHLDHLLSDIHPRFRKD